MHSELAFFEKVAIVTNAILTLLSSIFTWEGLSYCGAASNFQAFLRVAGAALISIVSWWWYFKYFPSATSKQRGVMSVGIVGVSVLMISLSSVYGAVGLSAERLTKIHLQENLKAIEEIRDELIKRRRGIEEIKSTLENGKQAFVTFSEQEKNGLITGRRGKARAVKSLRGLVKGFDTIIESIEDYTAETDLLEQKSQALSRQLASVIEGELSILEKSQQAQVLFNRINATFTSMQKSPAIDNWIQNIDSIFLIDSEKTEVLSKSLSTPLRKVKGSLLDQIQSMPKVDEVVLQRFVTLDSLQLLIRYAHLSFAEIIGILSTDVLANLASLAGLVFLHARFKESSSNSSSINENEDSYGQRAASDKDSNQIPEWLEKRIAEQVERKSKGNKKGKAA
ncbi:MAG: hypothetical protein JXR76_15345 [Deltaproteobacteria bacterium]|nr:hypothetical protein [Deltaproteobacteria bacterium]